MRSVCDSLTGSSSICKLITSRRLAAEILAALPGDAFCVPREEVQHRGFNEQASQSRLLARYRMKPSASMPVRGVANSR